MKLKNYIVGCLLLILSGVASGMQTGGVCECEDSQGYSGFVRGLENIDEGERRRVGEIASLVIAEVNGGVVIGDSDRFEYFNYFLDIAEGLEVSLPDIYDIMYGLVVREQRLVWVPREEQLVIFNRLYDLSRREQVDINNQNATGVLVSYLEALLESRTFSDDELDEYGERLLVLMDDEENDRKFFALGGLWCICVKRQGVQWMHDDFMRKLAKVLINSRQKCPDDYMSVYIFMLLSLDEASRVGELASREMYEFMWRNGKDLFKDKDKFKRDIMISLLRRILSKDLVAINRVSDDIWGMDDGTNESIDIAKTMISLETLKIMLKDNSNSILGGFLFFIVYLITWI